MLNTYFVEHLVNLQHVLLLLLLFLVFFRIITSDCEWEPILIDVVVCV